MDGESCHQAGSFLYPPNMNMKKQQPKTQESPTPKVNFLIVALLSVLLIALFDHYSKASSPEANKANSLRPSPVSSANTLQKQYVPIPTVKPSQIVFPSIAPVLPPSPMPTPTSIETQEVTTAFPSYAPCTVGSYTYRYLTDTECQEYKDREDQRNQLIIEQEQSAIEGQKLRQDAYDACLASATQRAYGICGSLGTCDSYGYGGFDTILSNEKAKILHVLKEKKPSSIYELAKILDRDFKSVKTDLDVLKKFDFITFTKQQKGKRASLKPELKIEKIDISIEL